MLLTSPEIFQSPRRAWNICAAPPLRASYPPSCDLTFESSAQHVETNFVLGLSHTHTLDTILDNEPHFWSLENDLPIWSAINAHVGGEPAAMRMVRKKKGPCCVVEPLFRHRWTSVHRLDPIAGNDTQGNEVYQIQDCSMTPWCICI